MLKGRKYSFDDSRLQGSSIERADQTVVNLRLSFTVHYSREAEIQRCNVRSVKHSVPSSHTGNTQSQTSYFKVFSTRWVSFNIEAQFHSVFKPRKEDFISFESV